MNKIFIIGIAGESVFLSVDRLPHKGETVCASECFCELGGKGLNQALAAVRSGGKVSFLTAIGSDGYQQKVENFCKKENINLFVAEKIGYTAYAVIQTELSGENFVCVHHGVQLSAEDVSDFENEISTSSFLLITNEIPQETFDKAIELANRYKVKVVYNPAPYRSMKEAIKDKIYLFTPNEHECEGLKENQNVIVTMGKKGCYIKSMELFVPATCEKSVDTTGAGDVFNGVLVAMLANGSDLKTSVETANKWAGKSVTKRGALSSVPYLNEI